jgi:TPR repeat protein
LYNAGLGVASGTKEAQKWFRRAASHAAPNGTLADVAQSCGTGPDAR